MKRTLPILLILCLLLGALPLSASAGYVDGGCHDTWQTTGNKVQFEFYRSNRPDDNDYTPVLSERIGPKVESLAEGHFYWLECNVSEDELSYPRDGYADRYRPDAVGFTLITEGDIDKDTGTPDYYAWMGLVYDYVNYGNRLWVEFYCGYDFGDISIRPVLRCYLSKGGGYPLFYYSSLPGAVISFDGSHERAPGGKPSLAYNSDIDPSGSTTYTGKPITPGLDGVWSYHTLQPKDYTLSYRNNVDAGEAIMTVSGRGYFGGTFDIPFTIYPAQLNMNGVRVTGECKVGSTLSVTEILANGIDPVNSTFSGTYQWQANSEDIPGATKSTYTLTENELGKVIHCKVTANCSNYEGTGYGAAGGTVKPGSGRDESPAVPFAPPAPPAPGVGPFTDVAIGSYYADAVEWAYYNGVTTGTSDTTFAPANTCTRAQVLTFLWRAMGEPEPASTVNPFEDVLEGSYYHKPVLWAVEQGITTGTGDTTFSPEDTCSFAQILTFIWRCQGKPGATGAGGWYDDAFAWADTNRLLTDTNAASAIESGCPRSDVVTYLYRIMVK